MSEYVSKKLRTAIARRAGERCEYCHCPAKYCIDPFVAEHIQPVARGGQTASENLAFACIGCNGFKLDKTESYDAVSQMMTPLFNPRIHRWAEHFACNEEFTHIVPLTAIGRVTVAELQLNREGVVSLRMLLIMVGKHPPEE